MKKVLIAVLIGLSLTGCAQIQNNIRREFTPITELAMEDCEKMNFRKGTPAFQQCVLVTSVNIRNARASAAAAAAAAQIAAPRRMICGRVGSYITCNEH